MAGDNVAENIPSHLEIEELTEKFLGIMKAREVGLASYLIARTQAAERLYEALGKVLGKS